MKLKLTYEFQSDGKGSELCRLVDETLEGRWATDMNLFDGLYVPSLEEIRNKYDVEVNVR